MKTHIIAAIMLTIATSSTSASFVKKDSHGSCYIPEQPEYSSIVVFVAFSNTPYCRFNISPIFSEGYPEFVNFKLEESKSSPYIMEGLLRIGQGNVKFTCDNSRNEKSENNVVIEKLINKGLFPSYCYATT